MSGNDEKDLIKARHAWVYPWDLKNWQGPIDQQDWIFYQLHKLNYQVDRWKETPPTKNRNRLVLLLDVLATLYMSKDRWPWLLVVSNSQTILQELGQVIPMIWALTDHKSVDTVSTPLLVDLLRSRKPQDDWQDDPVGERLYQIQTAQLLWWEFVDAGVPGSEKLEARFRELLRHKIQDQNEVLVMTYYAEVDDMTDEKEKKLWSSIQNNLGKSVAGVVRRKAAKYLIKAEEQSGGPWMTAEG